MPSLKQTSRSLHSIGSKIIGANTGEKIKMPGKSNKFDYTNRPNSGAKLGEIIGSNLQKEAEKVKKDAERHAGKARKQSIGSADGASGPHGSTYIIDLKAPSKDLGDDGVCAMANGMEIALRSGTDAACFALEDLNLSNNSITTASLARLASVIKLARLDLKTINLSDNRIEVASDEQAQHWETFLLAFADCMKLRRLDLSGNERLGSRALEIMARVHVNEPPITPAPPGGTGSVLSLVSEVAEDTERHSEKADSVAESEEEGLSRKMLDGTILDRRCGLRSIPYITLHNIGLDTAGALWLSYIVEDHYYPSQLISELNATNAESIIKAYQQNTHNHGLDWSANEQLGKEGGQLLDRTEAIREHRLHDEAVDSSDLLDGEEDEALAGHTRRSSSERLAPRSKAGTRRASIRSIRTTDGGEHETSELESARKKIMRHIIGHERADSVELWKTALSIFWASRLVLLMAPTIRKHHTGVPIFATHVPAPPTVQPPTPLTSPVEGPSSGLRIDIESARSIKASYASKLQVSADGTPGEPDLAITEVTNTPTTPLRLQRPSHRKGGFSEGTEIETVAGKLNALVVRDDSPLRFVKYQQRRIDAKTAEGKVFRDRSSPSHLPPGVLEHLVSFCVGPLEIGVCGSEQRRRAIARGQDRSSLTAEREWLKKDRSAQVLMLLDSIQCLHYGQ